MSDLKRYVEARKKRDRKFAKGYESGYENFKIGAMLCLEREKAGLTHFLPEPLVHIPLIMTSPGQIPEGLEIDALVSQVDVMPSILDYAGSDVPHGLDGRPVRDLV